MNADLILFNGQFHTVDRENPRAKLTAAIPVLLPGGA